MSIDQAYNYRAVSETVATAGVLKPEQLATLGDDGIEVVINLLPDSSESAVKEEKTIVQDQGIEYWYLPVDFSAPRLEEYVKFKDKLSQLGDKKLIIHCAANYRVSAFYSRYAIEFGIWSVDEADRFMLSIWKPSEYPGWPQWLDEVEHSAKSS
jgi:protein tyrosine phosphatase (PTP) superfamily phosphohydrolase (DUF442 family)